MPCFIGLKFLVYRLLCTYIFFFRRPNYFWQPQLPSFFFFRCCKNNRIFFFFLQRSNGWLQDHMLALSSVNTGITDSVTSNRKTALQHVETSGQMNWCFDQSFSKYEELMNHSRSNKVNAVSSRAEKWYLPLKWQ